MEKRVVVALVLSLALMFVWSAYQQAVAPPEEYIPPADVQVPEGPPAADPPAEAGQEDGAAGGNAANPADPAANPGVDQPNGAAAGAGSGRAFPPVVTHELRSEHVRLTMTSAGAAIASARPWACDHHERWSDDVSGDPGSVTDRFEGVPGALSVELVGKALALATRSWEVVGDPTADQITFRTTEPDSGFVLTKSYVLSSDAKHPYHVDVTVTIERPSDVERAPEMLTLQLTGPWLPENEDILGADNVLVAIPDEDVEELDKGDLLEFLQEDPNNERPLPDGVRWVGTRADFHVGLIQPAEPLPKGSSLAILTHERPRETPEDGEKTSGAAALRVPIAMPDPGASQAIAFRFYVGPASRPLMAEDGSPYEAFADSVQERGFLFLSFTPISRLLAWVLNLLAGTGMGYGLAVACLTLIVRGLMFPLSKKSQVSMRVHAKKMQAIKPKMEAIKERYKDPRKQQEMTMKLMRQEKVSLLPGGCLLIFIQMPIWIALFGVLQSTFEMRHASFLWADDLTAPDQFLALPFAEGWPLLDGWLNLFPILMMITWGISARMSPLPDDPQQRSQAKMMRWMPMLFGLFLYNYACGLTVYMTMSALWSIGEVQYIRRVILPRMGLTDIGVAAPMTM